MSADSIDVLDEIKVEVHYNNVKSYIYHESSEDVRDHKEVTEIYYEGRNITNELGMFTDDELIASDTLETELSLTSIKALAE